MGRDPRARGCTPEACGFRDHHQALLAGDGMIEHAFYPVFPPNAHAEQVLTWPRDNPR
ncbi:hypothetical protein [Streptomyces sp. NPDC127098]|uniref:hypothetical protein n=1 Tax=Streptomyces sp. NPDC127098 TaxID=3347137 RepID=UPI0036546C44